MIHRNEAYSRLYLKPRATPITDKSPAGRTVTDPTSVTVVADADFVGGYAMVFDGGDRLTFAQSPDFAPGTKPFSLVWDMKLANSAAYGSIFCLEEVATEYLFDVSVYSGGIGITEVSPASSTLTGTAGVLFPATLTNGPVYRCALTKDAAGLHCFVNGARVGSAVACPNPFPTINGGVEIGRFTQFSGNPIRAFYGRLANYQWSPGICRVNRRYTPPTRQA
jgi:hypothetical protein